MALPVADVPGPDWGYPYLEEYFAQVVMNMYLRELGRPVIFGYRPWGAGASRAALPPSYSLRAGRARAPESESQWRAVARFEQTNIRRWAFKALRLQHLFDRFAALDRRSVPYNPFRDANLRHPEVLLPTRPPRYGL